VGEACGQDWDDIDLDGLTLTVRWQIVQHAGPPPWTLRRPTGSDATIALDWPIVSLSRASIIHMNRGDANGHRSLDLSPPLKG
jgi:integrase